MRWWQLNKRDADLERELRSDLELEEEEQRDRGESPEEARFAARRAFGNALLIKERTHEAWGWARFEHWWQDLRYALRQMRQSPVFAASVIGTLALGIGATAAMFTVVDHVLLRPTSCRDAGRLVSVQETNGSDYTWPSPWLDIESWQAQSKTLGEIAFSAKMSGRNFLVHQTAGLEVDAERVSSNLFSVLGVHPLFGNGFLRGDGGSASKKNTNNIVLSYTAWSEVFAGDPAISGKVVKINNDSYTVVGVMPAGFLYPEGSRETPQAWIPIQLGSDDASRNFKAMQYTVLARLSPGATVESANSEMSLLQKHIAADYTDAGLRKDHSVVRIVAYADLLVNRDIRSALLALQAASGVLWLIAVVNAANLLLARSVVRRREIAMRGALGASRWRLMRQMMIESLVLSCLAAALGAGAAIASVRLFAHELAQTLPVPVPATPDGSVLAALVALTVLSAMLSTLWPAFLSARNSIDGALRQGGIGAGADHRHPRVRSVLVAAEIAMSLGLLVVCGLLLRTIYTLRHVQLGFRTDHILVANLSIPSYRFAGQNMSDTLYRPLLERVQNLHGVDSAGLISEVPLGKTFVLHMEMQLSSSTIVAFMKAVSPEMPKVFGFRMMAGRFFGPEDTANSEPVIVVNEAFARLYSPDPHNPAMVLGARIGKTSPLRIVGILDDERQKAIAEPAVPEIEVDLPQISPASGFYRPIEGTAMDLAVRTNLPASAMIPELRNILRQASPELQNATMTTMEQIVEDSYGNQRLAAHLLELFGASALLICIAGLYGLLAYFVAQRTRELGVRAALGADRGDLLWLIMRQAGTILFVGAVVGTGLAEISVRLVRGFLYGVNPHDGWTLAGAAAVLISTGLLAAYLPARRAASIDPMQALRIE